MRRNSVRDRRSLTSSPDPRLITAVLAFAGMSASFMQTLVVPIQAKLPSLLDAERSETAWVITATLLGACIFTPVSGRLGDLYGKRRMAVASLIVLVIGSVICALAGDVWTLVAGRALQGAVLGIIPLGISILRDTLRRDRLPAGIAMVSATLGIGGALGLPLSALVAQTLDWHVLFWLSAGLGVLNIVLLLIVVPVSTLRSPGSFDVVGAIGLALGLSGVLIAVSRGNEVGWTSPGILGAGLGGVAVLGLWGWYELRQDSPLVDLRVAARPAVLYTNLASVAVGFAFFGAQITLPQLLELPAASGVGFGLSLIVASLVLAPAGLAMMGTSPLAARLTSRLGPRSVLVAGTALIAASYLLLLFLAGEVWQILAINALIGVGIGLAYAAMPTLIMHAVPASETAAANGLNTLMRTLGNTLSSAVTAAVLAQLTISVGAVSVPSSEGFRAAFVIGAAGAVVGVVLSLLIPRTSRPEAHPSLP
ncbi:MFS transporter [Arthrobacter sp. MYb23]|uniref:MFS transporter n=1 Tax=unclassified Arthrobacter TaxID=235627 RepID=UPI000CFC793A|nr:MFS transporter [Arthrobacter sp. MYb51]PRB94784.1 MFS transporter [Arthrobacter sp. MYb23]